MTTPPFSPPSEHDIRIVSQQLGRPARGVLGIAARCVCGAPTVVATAPRLDDGTPFPTLYYLSHPAATAAMSTLEATGVMPALAAELEADEALREGYARAHEAYLADRLALADVAELHGISAGGMPTRVKCLHALAAHALAAGPGVNPIGDRALALSTWSPAVCQCADYDDGVSGSAAENAGESAGDTASDNATQRAEQGDLAPTVSHEGA